jgi:hypothetical protein
MAELLEQGEGFRARNPSLSTDDCIKLYGPVHFEPEEPLGVRDGLAWSRFIARVPVVGSGQVCRLAVVGLTAVNRMAKGNVLVFPGANGMPFQVAGLVPPDYPDRVVGPGLALAGYNVFVVDYGPDFASSLRAKFLADEADRLFSLGRSYALAIVAVGVALAERCRSASEPVSGLLGHSVGAFLAALAASISRVRAPLVLASGVVSRTTLYGAEAKGGPLHRLDSCADKLFGGFSELLAAIPDTPVQIQYGLQDQIFGVGALAAEANIVALRRPSNTQIKACNMGHGTDVSELIRFIVSGGQTYDVAC